MGNYVYILNFDRKEYIGYINIQRYRDPWERKYFDQCLFDALIGPWKGNKIGAYDEDGSGLPDDFATWKDVTTERPLRHRKPKKFSRMFLEIKKALLEIKNELHQAKTPSRTP